MNKLILTFLFTLTIYPLTSEAGVWDRIKSVFVEQDAPRAPSIRVLLCHDASQAIVEVKGHYNVYDPFKNEKLASRFAPRRSSLEVLPTGIRWGEEFIGTFQLKIVPDDAKTRVLVNGIEYKGVLYAYDVGGKVSIVNEVDIEDYVSAVLSPLFDAPLSKEGMNAIAIAARTDAYHLTQHASNPFYHVSAKDAGYLGCGLKGKHNGIDQAVQNTRYMVMSQSTQYSRAITTFATHLITKHQSAKKDEPTALSVDEVEGLAQNGKKADKILNQIFPNTTIAVVHGPFGDRGIKEMADTR